MTSAITRSDRRTEADPEGQSPSADLVRVYLNGIGKTALLNAEDEVELSKRIEAGLYAKHLLETKKRLGPVKKADLKTIVAESPMKAAMKGRPSVVLPSVCTSMRGDAASSAWK